VVYIFGRGPIIVALLKMYVSDMKIETRLGRILSSSNVLTPALFLEMMLDSLGPLPTTDRHVGSPSARR
jgi:hypothetical protein